MRTWSHLALLLLTTPALAEPIVGRASVIDGDTLDVRGTRIRLHGIDAPESGQTCKDAAGKDYRCGQAAALSDRIGAAPIACEPRDTDRYGQTVAVCRKGAEDLNGWSPKATSSPTGAMPRTMSVRRPRRRRRSAASGPASSRSRPSGAEKSAPAARTRDRTQHPRKALRAARSRVTSAAKVPRFTTYPARAITIEPGSTRRRASAGSARPRMPRRKAGARREAAGPETKTPGAP